ncbi:hypothetical protein ACF0H5_013302 [Mactra antiquata]
MLITMHRVVDLIFVLLSVNVIYTALATSAISAEWAAWSEYGECSRSCGGGLANKTRTCLGASQTCIGSDIRFKVCNTMECEDNKLTLREIQCQTYNNVSIKENYFHWKPYYSSDDPCVLYCQSVETSLILKMQGEAMNGTICGPKGGGVCISGRCKNVGCDNVVGSKKKLDICGVCDGDGTTCLTRHNTSINNKDREIVRRYSWDIVWSACSKSCGTGVQVSVVVCRDNIQEIFVSDDKCKDMTNNIATTTRSCVVRNSCLYRWHTSKWGSCSRSCGEGFKYRRVVCLKHRRGEKKHEADDKCQDIKPASKTACYLGDCPEWLTGPWSPCSGPCGFSEQKRKVVCRAPSQDMCLSEHKPVSVQKCFTGKSCDEKDSFQQDDSSVIEQHDFYDDAKLQDLIITPEFEVGDWDDCSVTCGVGYIHRDVSCMKGNKKVPSAMCQGIEPDSKRECHKGECPVTSVIDSEYIWSQKRLKSCSQTCGRGIQSSIVECIDIKTNNTVLDSMCDENRRPEPLTQYCNSVVCPPAWKVSEYDACSAPCGGGRQSRSVECQQITSIGGIKNVPSYRCPDPIPLSERSCNDIYCQAEWRTGSWGECSVTCGMGMETRPVYCVKHVKTDSIVNVSVSECIGPRPAFSRHCHFGDCNRLQQLTEIKERKGTFIQIKRTKRIQIYVGENAVILPNQSVKIKCPVKNFHKKLIFWMKDRRLIPMVGRIRASTNGALRIKRANPDTDAGIFTCSASMIHAHVNVSFQTKKEARDQADKILDEIFHENFNESFINRPQQDGGFKMKNTEYFRINPSRDNDSYDYTSVTTSEWTKCSEQCGWGSQTRVVTCNHVTDKFIRLLPEEECLKSGMKKPVSQQKCLIQRECPQWVAEDWPECSTEDCSKDGYSMQKRLVRCMYKNGTLAKSYICNDNERPLGRQFCKNKQCKARWQTSKWTECQPRCGIRGKKTRTLLCVWEPTKQPAYDMCNHIGKPSLMKSCKPAKCSSGSNCVDETTYCSLVGQLKMCRYHKFRQKCCHTCRSANI